MCVSLFWGFLSFSFLHFGFDFLSLFFGYLSVWFMSSGVGAFLISFKLVSILWLVLSIVWCLFDFGGDMLSEMCSVLLSMLSEMFVSFLVFIFELVNNWCLIFVWFL